MVKLKANISATQRRNTYVTQGRNQSAGTGLTLGASSHGNHAAMTLSALVKKDHMSRQNSKVLHQSSLNKTTRTVGSNLNTSMVSRKNAAKINRMMSPKTPQRRNAALDTSQRTTITSNANNLSARKQVGREVRSQGRASNACDAKTPTRGQSGSKNGVKSVHYPAMYVMKSTKKLTEYQEFNITPSGKSVGGSSYYISPCKLKKLEKKHGVRLLGGEFDAHEDEKHSEGELREKDEKLLRNPADMDAYLQQLF